MRKALWFLLPIAILSVALVAAACDDDDDVGDIADGDTEAPSVSITDPEDGATVPAGDVTVNADVSNFDVVEALGEDPAPGQGHVHFFMDVEPPTTQGEPAVTAEGTYHATATTSHTWENVEAGEHTFSAQLVNNNHTPLETPIVDQVTVTVE